MTIKIGDINPPLPYDSLDDVSTPYLSNPLVSFENIRGVHADGY